MNVDKYLDQLEAYSISIVNRKDDMTPHQKKVHESFVGNFGCKTSFVCQFASAFMQYQFRDEHFFPRGSIVIPLKNENGHDYPLGIPVYMIQEEIGISASRDTYGNNLPKIYGDVNRMGTEAEIRFFFAEIRKNVKAKNLLSQLMNQGRINYIG